jgi:hypothetical protein
VPTNQGEAPQEVAKLSQVIQIDEGKIQAHLGEVVVHFEQMAQEATLLDYLHEVEHAATRIMRLDGAIEEVKLSAAPDARRDRGIAAVTRANRARFGGDNRSRTGRTAPVCQSKAANGLRRNRSQRKPEWRAHATRTYHQDGEFAFTAGCC